MEVLERDGEEEAELNFKVTKHQLLEAQAKFIARTDDAPTLDQLLDLISRYVYTKHPWSAEVGTYMDVVVSDDFLQKLEKMIKTETMSSDQRQHAAEIKRVK